MIKGDRDYGWSDAEEVKLRRLAAKGTMFYSEIANELGRRPASVHWKRRKLGLPSNKEKLRSRCAEWNRKHVHLQGPVISYYQKHSFAETAKRFGLTLSEMKSCLTYAYKNPDLLGIRKATNDHSPWSTKHLKFLLRHCGLRPRTWVAKQIGRGNDVCIKERLQRLGLSSRTLQGITLSQFMQAFGKRPDFYLQTDAGPKGISGKWSIAPHWKIVPWVWLDQELKAKRLKTAPEFRQLVSARAMFQEWIFEGNALRKMKRIVKAAKRP